MESNATFFLEREFDLCLLQILHQLQLVWILIPCLALYPLPIHIFLFVKIWKWRVWICKNLYTTFLSKE
jgi:hypothetical protein